MKKLKKLILILLIFFDTQPKIRLLTFHFNRPDFIEIQHKTFQKFLKDDYELIVFNDAKDPKLEEEIEKACNKLGIKHVRFPQHLHHKSNLLDEVESWSKLTNITGLSSLNELKGSHPSIRHCHVIQFAMDNFGYDHDDIVGIIDGDMFLIREFNIRNFLKNKQIIGTLKYDQTNSVNFFWVALTFFDLPNLPNKKDLKFNLSLIDTYVTDSGGHSFHYLKNNPEVKFEKYHLTTIPELANKNIKELKESDFSTNEIIFIKQLKNYGELHLNHHFLHYCRSSFVNESESLEFHRNKSDVFKNFIERILK